ncbi:hypothetical protein FGM00_04705 [Aggregatimonas sangjinii]|uniref:Uncharacterized protein n=1 Tax=Aggregatimonas sangjinii TaxID=2583587 RepID=A0A5B7SR03_9FLAO|nr:hypothetical protein [Aggregatimonas sangjinii]QCW99442.1 hypothetical protein FGM00_04705 [Aggregatimonas sangjinii]
MTGKKLLHNEALNVQDNIEMYYGTTDNFYNELYLKFLDRHSAVERHLKARVAAIDKQIEWVREEIAIFGSQNAEKILDAIRLDAEILITKKELAEHQEELAKYDTGFLSFWEDIKHKFGFN